MRKRSKSFIICAAASVLAILFAWQAVMAAYSQVITFGADLNRSQKSMLASEFGVNLASSGVPVVDVTNAEERKYLKGLVPDEVIGYRAISSAMVEMLPAGSGLSVQTRNINWVTSDMYINALATGGVKDARVAVTAPFPVSGTAALTGIFKAVEYGTGKSLGDRRKKVANEELVRTVNLGREIGRENATRLIMIIKERVIAEKATDPERIRQIVINVAGDLNINLNNAQIDEITVLMQKVSGLGLKANDLYGQIRNLKGEVEKAVAKQAEVKSWLQRLLVAINRLVEQVRALFLGTG